MFKRVANRSPIDVRRVLCAIGFLIPLALSPSLVRGDADIAGAEVDALVLDRTLTRIGHDFFREFVTRLGAEDGIPGVSLTVREKVSAQWGGVITVEADDKVIFTAPLRPRGAGVAEIADQAAGATADYLVRTSGTELQPEDEDLDEDGL